MENENETSRDEILLKTTGEATSNEITNENETQNETTNEITNLISSILKKNSESEERKRNRNGFWASQSRPVDDPSAGELPERIAKDCSRCKARLHDYKNPCEFCKNGDLFR